MNSAADALVAYIERGLEAMAAIVGELGNDLANKRPALDGANSPYVILRHCLGVLEFWGGHAVAGRETHRDRAAEFVASGPPGALIEAARRAGAQFRADAASAELGARPRGTDPRLRHDEFEMRSQEHVLLHIMEEIYQHLGQLEITRDLLARPRA